MKAPKPGVYTPTVTFFKKDGYTLDVEAQCQHAQYLHDAGIEGLVMFGSTGENAHLTRKERVQVVAAVHKKVPNITIMCGVTQNNLQDTVEEIAEMATAGASYALVLCSNYYGAGIYQAGIIDWYTKVADASKLPILLYVYPGVSNGLVTSLETVKTLSKHPNIVGTKFSYGDVADYTVIAGDSEIAANDFHFFSGLGQLLTTVLLLGGKGVIDGLSNVTPKVYVKIFNLVQEGKIAEATALQHRVTKCEILLGPDVIVNLKKAVKAYAGIGEYVLGRSPLSADSPVAASEPFFKAFEEVKKIEELL